MNRNTDQYNKKRRPLNRIYQKGIIYISCVIILFIFIGILTTVSPAYRFSSHAITEWTSEIDSSTFLYLMGMENKAFLQAYPKDRKLPKLSSTIFDLATNIRPNDFRSLLGNELPGFSTFDTKIIVAGEGTDYTTLPVESSPPLEKILEDREAVFDEPEEADDSTEKGNQDKRTTGKRDVVFIYNTHNRESFLPSLPGVTDKDSAMHDKINVTKVSDRLAKSLEANGIGTSVDHTDFMPILNEKGWGYAKSYDASRSVVEEVFQDNKDIQYAFDIHRDSLSGDKTTTEIDGKKFAKIMIVIGDDNTDNQTNLALATDLHKLLEKEYPGLSRGVIKRGGAGANGVYNQDLLDTALLFEIGGVDNNFDELHRSADALADVFSEFYWDAEKVNAEEED